MIDTFSPLEKISVVPVWLAYKGWCSTMVLENTKFVTEKEEFVWYIELPYSFEATSWQQIPTTERKTDFPNHTRCNLISGFYSGWLSLALDFQVTTIECLCKARGDPTCLLIISSKDYISNSLGRLKSFLIQHKIYPVEIIDKIKETNHSWVDDNIKDKPRISLNDDDLETYKKVKKKRKSLNIELRKKFVRAPSHSKPRIFIGLPETELEGGDSSNTDNSLPLNIKSAQITKRETTGVSTPKSKRYKPATPEVLLKATEDFFKQLSVKPENSTSIKIGEEGYIFVIEESLVLDLEKLMLEFNNSQIPHSPGMTNSWNHIDLPLHVLHLSK